MSDLEDEALKKLSEACDKVGATMVVFGAGAARTAAQMQQFANALVVTGQLEVTFCDEHLLRRFKMSDALRAEELRLPPENYCLEAKPKQRHDYWNVQGKRGRWK